MPASCAALLRACSLLLCLVAGSRQLSITEFIVPDVVEVGEDAELRCQYELGPDESDAALYVKWWWRPVDSLDDNRRPIYQRIAGQTAESIHTKMKIKENDTIVLLELTPFSSGVYECEVSNIDELREHGELIVFTKGTGPELNISTMVDSPDNSDNLLIVCEAQDVAPLPYLMVTINDGEEINMTQVVSGPTSDGMFSVYAYTNRSKDELTGVEIRCELLYVNPNITHPQYIDVESYNPAGDDGYRIQCSWIVRLVVLALLHTIL